MHGNAFYNGLIFIAEKQQEPIQLPHTSYKELEDNRVESRN